MSLSGYHGQYLLIDLSRGRYQTMRLRESTLRQFLGGTGLGAHLLLQSGQADRDPLSPEAPLAFVFSPLVGSPLTTSAIGPLTFATALRTPLPL